MPRLSLILLSFLLPLAGLLAVETVNSTPVEMEPFVVRVDKTRFENWGKVVSENFVLYTDLGESGAVSLLEKIERLYAEGKIIVGAPVLKSGKHVFVLPGDKSDWSKLELRSGTEWRPAAGVLWYEPGRVSIMREVSMLSQILSRTEDSYFIQSLIGLCLVFDTDHGRNLWMERGFGHIIGNAHVQEDHLEIGGAISAESRLSFRDYIPWEKFFRVNGRSPEYFTKAGIRKLDAQCALFARRFYVAHPEQLPALFDWARYLSDGGEPTEAEFRNRFGIGWAELEQELRNVHRKRKNQERPFSAPLTGTRPKITALAPGEMQQLFLLVQSLTWKPDSANGLLDHVLSKPLASPTLYPILADSCIRLNRKPKAIEALRAAQSHSPEVPQIPEFIARLLMELRVPLASIDQQFTSADSEIRELLERARSLDPKRSGPTELLLRFDAYSEKLPEGFVDKLTTQCAQETPGRRRAAHEFLLAYVLWRTDQHAAAIKHIDAITADPKAAPDTKKAAEALRQKMP